MVKNGQGLIISTSKNKKLNTKKLTEAELIGADDVMPQILWTRYFWERKDMVLIKTYCIKKT